MPDVESLQIGVFVNRDTLLEFLMYLREVLALGLPSDRREAIETIDDTLTQFAEEEQPSDD